MATEDATNEEVMAYVALCRSCGRAVYAAVDLPDEEIRASIAREIATSLKAGHIIERHPVHVIRAMDWVCQCDEGPVTAPLFE